MLNIAVCIAIASPIMLMHAWLYTWSCNYRYVYIRWWIHYRWDRGRMSAAIKSVPMHTQSIVAATVHPVYYIFGSKKCMVKLYLLIWSNWPYVVTALTCVSTGQVFITSNKDYWYPIRRSLATGGCCRHTDVNGRRLAIQCHCKSLTQVTTVAAKYHELLLLLCL